MKKITILALIVLGALSCKKKEEVKPDPVVTPVYVTPVLQQPITEIDSNHVKITFNSIEVMDSIKVIHGTNSVLVRSSHWSDSMYYVCNLSNGVSTFVTLVNDCNDGYLELIGDENIYLEYKGNVIVEYL